MGGGRRPEASESETEAFMAQKDHELCCLCQLPFLPRPTGATQYDVDECCARLLFLPEGDITSSFKVAPCKP